MPWQNRIDLRVDRGFDIPNSNARVSVFLWVQNVFDSDNINDVWRFTGLADNDGFLATPGGLAFLPGAAVKPFRRRLCITTVTETISA